LNLTHGQVQALSRQSLIRRHLQKRRRPLHGLWKDETGKMRFTTRRSFSDAKKLQSEKIEELRRHRETRFDIDDRQLFSLRGI